MGIISPLHFLNVKMRVSTRIISLILVISILCSIPICAVSPNSSTPFSVTVDGKTQKITLSSEISDIPIWDVTVTPGTTTIFISDVNDDLVGIWGTKYIANDYEAAVILSERNENGPLVTGENAYDQSTGTYTVQLGDFELSDEKTIVPLIGNDYFETGIQKLFLRVSYAVVAPFTVSVAEEIYDVNAHGTNSDGVSCWNVVVPDATNTISISDVSDSIVGIWGTKYIANDYEAAVILSERNENGPLVTGENAYDQSTGTYTVQLGDFELVNTQTLIPLIGNDYFETGVQKAFLYVTYLKTSDKSKLLDAIDSVPDETDYYTQDDRFNGNTYQETGFWSDMQLKLSEAKRVLNDSGAIQETVDKATTDLTTAIGSLISRDNVNPTILYETIHTDWRWYYNELRLKIGTPVSAENCTALTWDAYAQTEIDGQALLDELYDADGNPTDVNTSDRNDEVKAAATAIDAHKLVNMDAYDSAYETYQSGKVEAETLIEQYDPEKLTAENYSTESWKAFTDAHAALKADLAYRIVGGSTEDYAMLKDFTQHIEALKNTRKQLVSDKDITISFTYINNFSAQFEKFRENGTNLYVNAELELTKGTATLADAIEAAGLVLDKHDDQTIPGGANNNSDTLPWLMLFVNGNNYGLLQERLLSTSQLVQLHNGDVVRLVRICQPLQLLESSTGYDSTAVNLDKTFNEEHYRDSIAKIDMTAPTTSKVGAKTAVSATVTGANATNLGKTLNPKNVTLFISAPTEEETLSPADLPDNGDNG